MTDPLDLADQLSKRLREAVSPAIRAQGEMEDD